MSVVCADRFLLIQFKGLSSCGKTKREKNWGSPLVRAARDTDFDYHKSHGVESRAVQLAAAGTRRWANGITTATTASNIIDGGDGKRDAARSTEVYNASIVVCYYGHPRKYYSDRKERRTGTTGPPARVYVALCRDARSSLGWQLVIIGT